jgi:hypothetical protein
LDYTIFKTIDAYMYIVLGPVEKNPKIKMTCKVINGNKIMDQI